MKCDFHGLFSAASLLLLSLGYITSVNGRDLDAAAQQLDALTSRMVSLSKKLDSITADKDRSERRSKWFGKLLDRYEGVTGACKRGYFPCGPGQSGAVQCVRDYLVCDGSADCRNGADEADDVCGRLQYFAKPRKYHGLLIYDRCGSGQVFDVMTASRRRHVWSIPPAHVTPWFPSEPLIFSQWMPPTESTDGQIEDTVSMNLIFSLDLATGNLHSDMNTLHALLWTEEVEADRLRLHVDAYRTYDKEPCYFNVYKEVNV